MSPGPRRWGCRPQHREAGEVDSLTTSTICGCVKRRKPDGAHPRKPTKQAQALLGYSGVTSPLCVLPVRTSQQAPTLVSSWGESGVSPRKTSREYLKPVLRKNTTTWQTREATEHSVYILGIRSPKDLVGNLKPGTTAYWQYFCCCFCFHEY